MSPREEVAMYARIAKVLWFVATMALGFLFGYGLWTEEYLTARTVMLYLTLLPVIVICSTQLMHLFGRIDWECTCSVVFTAASVMFLFFACSLDTSVAEGRVVGVVVGVMSLLLMAVSALNMWLNPCRRAPSV